MKVVFMFIILNTLFVRVNAQKYGDTLYIGKHNSDSNYQVIFIDTSHSNFHKFVFDILLSNANEYDFNEKDKNRPNNINSKYIGQWITVKKYKGEFYAYCPSEPYYNTFIKLTDSNLVINDFNEGFVSYLIGKEKRKRRKAIFEFFGHTGIKHFLSIKQKTKTLFIMKSSLFNVSKIYFVKRASYVDFPIIVNYCPINRCPEFTFK